MKITGYLSAALVAAFAFVGAALAQGGPGGGPGPVPPGPWVVQGANTIYNKGSVLVGNGLTGLGIGAVNVSGNYYVNGAVAKTTVNGQNCALGGTCVITAVAASITVGTTGITGGASTNILYDNAGTLGEYTISGSGTAVAMANSPVLVTPTLGVATATSINKVAITAPATSATLTIANGKTLTANNSLTLAGTDATTMTFPGASDTVVTLAASQNLTNKTLTSPVITSTSAVQITNGVNAQSLYAGALCANSNFANCATTPTNGLQVQGTSTLGVVTGTSLALGGATIGTNALAVTGTQLFGGAQTISMGADNVTFQTINGAGGNGRLISSIDSGGGVHLRSQNSQPIALGVNAADSLSVSTTGVTITNGFTATGLVTYAAINGGSIANAANYFSGAANALVPSSVIYQAETTTAFGTTTTFDFNTFINTAVTLSSNITTQNVANVKAGQAGTITFIQDATGNRTTAWNSVFKFASGVAPTLSTAANAVDVLAYSCRSATFCVASLVKQVQ